MQHMIVRFFVSLDTRDECFQRSMNVVLQSIVMQNQIKSLSAGFHFYLMIAIQQSYQAKRCGADSWQREPINQRQQPAQKEAAWGMVSSGVHRLAEFAGCFRNRKCSLTKQPQGADDQKHEMSPGQNEESECRLIPAVNMGDPHGDEGND